MNSSLRNHLHNGFLRLLRRLQRHPTGHVLKAQSHESLSEPLDVGSGLAGDALLDKAPVVVDSEQLLVLPTHVTKLLGVVGMVGGDEVIVAAAQGLQKLGDKGGGVLGQSNSLSRFVSVNQEADQLVLLVSFQHDVRHRGRGAGYGHFEEI